MTNAVLAPPTDPPNTQDGSRVWEIRLSSSLLCFHVNWSFQPSVDIKTVLSGLMDRLSNYAASSIEVCSFMLCDLDFEPLSLSLSSLPSCDLVSLINMLILFIILKALFQSLRKSLSLNLELSR
ncbi:hypothetical protein Tco_0749331 [Tanacetum coccineum]|uniref:Uncharacterized protein n=1 Tax=Tanacetum coccineum TaxID=301880 RepID=A0ABQ4YZ50_9ASTR